jgi:cell wall-associated NlpC family hydrolase
MRLLPHDFVRIGILPHVCRRRSSLAGLVATLLLTVLGLSACGGSGPSTTNIAATQPLPTRNPHAEAIEPVAGETAAYADLPTAQASDAPKIKKVKASAADLSINDDAAPTKDAAISDADVLKNGVALPPIEAPAEVREIIEAGNQIARTPYLWGGGHGKWLDTGYDCSGSVSFALASAGLLSGPEASGQLMSWGEPGPGKWITIYSSPTHVFMFVAGVRFDTGGQRATGSRWQATLRPTAGFVARHPAGL